MTIRIFGDTVTESTESILIAFSNPTGGPTIRRSLGTVAILDDDPTGGVEISVGDLVVVEGDREATSAFTRVHVPVTLSSPSAVPVDFHVKAARVGPDIATYNDFDSVDADLTIDAGVLRRFFTVRIQRDLAAEPDETFSVVLSEATNAAIARPVGTVTILDDDTPTFECESTCGLGFGGNGQIGDGTTTDRWVPHPVDGLSPTALAAGS